MSSVNRPLVNTYLMASYLYYCRHLPTPIDDVEFDEICKELLEQWDDIEHPHKYLIDLESLRAGTGYYIKKEDYPLMVKCAAMCWSHDPR